MLEGCDKTDKVTAVAEVAQKLGYDLPLTDLKEYIDKMEEEIKKNTDDVSCEIKDISDDDLDDVAGGIKYGYHPGVCKDTYAHYENCWTNDGLSPGC